MAFVVWLLLGGSVAFWGLRLMARPLPMPEAAVSAVEARPVQADLGRLLGVSASETSAEPEMAASTRLRLLGVVAPRNPRSADSGEGVALIEVDGVARTVRVGATVDGDLQLLRVEARSASLGRPGQAPSQVLQISPAAGAIDRLVAAGCAVTGGAGRQPTIGARADGAGESGRRRPRRLRHATGGVGRLRAPLGPVNAPAAAASSAQRRHVDAGVGSAGQTGPGDFVQVGQQGGGRADHRPGQGRTGAVGTVHAEL